MWREAIYVSRALGSTLLGCRSARAELALPAWHVKLPLARPHMRLHPLFLPFLLPSFLLCLQCAPESERGPLRSVLTPLLGLAQRHAGGREGYCQVGPEVSGMLMSSVWLNEGKWQEEALVLHQWCDLLNKRLRLWFKQGKAVLARRACRCGWVHVTHSVDWRRVTTKIAR